ncbi:MAG: hypothetical protein WAM11_10855 [Cyanobium sp.]
MTARPHRSLGMPAVFRPRSIPATGFLLPLASLASLLLLLGCLSMQTVALQSAQRLAAVARMRQAEDNLMSAAQQLVASLQRQYPCLLPLALDQWSGAACVNATQLTSLARGDVNAIPYQLVGWRPQAVAADPLGADPVAGAEMLLELRPSDGKPPLRSAFAVALQGLPPQVRDLRLLGLRGIAP